MLRTKKDVDRHVQDIFRKLQDENERTLRCFKIAELYYNVNDYESARRYLSRYVELRKEPRAHKLMGQILEALGQNEAALVQYKCSFELNAKQEDLILKICELLADPDMDIDVNRAKYWIERAESLFPRNKIVFQLKEKVLSIEKPSNNEADLENLILAELAARPTDVVLRVKLLKHYMDNNKFEDAYRHACEIEATNVHRDSLLWYQTLCDLFLKFKTTKQISWSFWILYISSLERLASLAIKEQGNSVRKPSEAIQAVYNFDQHLFEAKAQSFTSYPSLTEKIFEHMWGQLHFHMACLLLLNTKYDQSSWSESGRLCSPLLLTALYVKPIDLTASWAAHVDNPIKNQLQFYYREGSYRCSQAGHILQDYSKGNQKKLISNIEKFCTGSWRERVYQRIFVGRMYQKIRTSYFTNNNALAPPLRLVSQNELKRYDEVAEEVWPHSLHHQVWPSIKSRSSGSSQTTKYEGPQPNLSSHLFPDLQFSVFNINNASPVSICRLDIDAFLNAAALCASAVDEEQQRNNLLSPDRLPTLPADLTNPLCSEEQEKWWSSACKIYRKETTDDMGEIRQTLQRGLEIVRCIGNHGLHPIILVHLARVFQHRAKQLKEKNSESGDIPALESRSELYWSAVVPLLERLQNNQTIRLSNIKLFEYTGKTMNNMELTHAIEEGKLLMAQKLVKDKLYEQAIEALQALKCPEASFEQGKIYKKLADESINSLPKESVTSEMRSQHIIILSKARNCFYLTLDRLRSPDADPKHPLNADLCTHITSVENELKRIDPDIVHGDRHRNDGDDFSEESYSSAHSEEHPVVTNSMPMLNHTASQTPIRNVRRTPRQASTPRHHHTQDYLDATRNRVEARPSPERLDAQIRQLVHSIESLKEQSREQHRVMISKFDELIKIHARNNGSAKEASKARAQPPPMQNVTSTIEDELYGYIEDEYRDYGNFNSTSVPNPTNRGTPAVAAAAAAAAAAAIPQNLFAAQRQLYSPLVYPHVNPSALQNFFQAPMPFDPSVNMYAANAAALAAAAGYPAVSPMYRSGLEQHPIASMQQINENLQQGLFSQRLSEYAQSQQTQQSMQQLGMQLSEPAKNEPKLGFTPTNEASIPELSASLLKDSSIAAPSLSSSAAAAGPRGTIPVNVVITTSDTPPTTAPTTQPPLSVTIPAHHRLGVTTNQDLSNVPHSYQISMPSQPTILTTVNLPPLSTTLTMTSPITKTNVTDNQNSSILSTGSRHSSSDVTEVEHDPIPDFAPIIPLPDEVPVTTGEENEETLFCARAKLYRYADKEWKERGVGNVKLLKSEDGKVRLVMRREQVHKICANHMLRKDMDLTPMPNNDKAYIWVANDFADEEVKLEKLCIKFKTPEEAASFKESFDKAKEGLPDENEAETEKPKMEMPKPSSTSTTTTTTTTKADTKAGVEKFGGFTFSATPVIQKPVEEAKQQPPAKPSPFASFTFGKTPEAAKTPAAFTFGTPSTTSASNTSSTTPASLFGNQEPAKNVFGLAQSADTSKVSEKEAGETVLLEQTATLMLFPSSTKIWNDKGSVALKVLSERTTGRIRFLMNNENNTKTVLDEVIPVTAAFKLKGDSVIWAICTGKNKSDSYLLRFKNHEQASLFHKTVQAGLLKPTNSVASEQQKPQPLGELFKPAAGSWECKDCYTRNNSTAAKCVACQGSKPGAATPAAAPVTTSIAKTPQDVKKNLFDKFKPAAGSWECKDCYTRNDAGTTACIACQAPAPDAPAVSQPTSASLSQSSNTWNCKKCKVVNGTSTQYCVACDEPMNPGMPPKPKTSGGFSINSQQPDVKPTFSFGISQADQQPAAAPTTTVPNKENTNMPTSFSFSFSKPQDDKPKSLPMPIFGAGNKTQSIGFSFGQQPPKTPPPNENDESNLQFGSPGKSFGFNFSSKTPQSPDRPETSDDEQVEESEDVYFAPVIPLPDKIEVKTGEEDEDVLYSHRAKLFKFDTATKEWKERGLGDIKLLRHVETKKLRLVMRRDQVLKLCLNHAITSAIEITAKDDKTWMWSAGDYSEGEIEYMQFACRFKTPEIAEEFKTAVDNACKGAPASSPRAATTTVSKTDSNKKEPSADIEIIYEVKVSPEEKAAALKLQLPENFYSYKYKDDCPGCIGCREPEEPLFKSSDAKSASATTTTTDTSSPFTFNNIFGKSTAPTASQTAAKPSFGTPTSRVFEANKNDDDSVTKTFGFGLKICDPTTKQQTPTATSAANIFSSFNASSTAAATTTTTSGSSNIFGGFGGTNTFSSTTNMFGGGTAKTTTPAFNFSSPSTTSSSSPAAKNIFSATSPFSAGTNTFGTNIFAASTTTASTISSGSLFGGSVTTSTTTASMKTIFGVVGTTASQTRASPLYATVVPPNSLVFGASTGTTTASMSSFGGVTETASTTSIFGSSVAVTTTSATPVFGATTIAKSATPIFGATTTSVTPIFGSAVTTMTSAPTSLFDANAATPTAPTLFGGNQAGVSPMFAPKTDANSTASPASTGSWFGAPKTTGVIASTQPGGLSNASSGTPATEESKPTNQKEASGVSFLPTDNSLSFSALAANTKPDQQPAFKTDPNFKFDGAGAAVFGAKPKKTESKKTTTKSPQAKTKDGKKDDDDDSDEGDENGDDHDPYFEPIIPLPDAIEVQTGEEDEEKAFCQRAKLYRYDENTKEWKERGTGEMKILHHEQRGTYRLLLRREQVYKVVCNHLLTADLEFHKMSTSNSAWVWAAMNYAEPENPQVEKLAVRFKTQELAEQFKAAIDIAQSALAQRQNQVPTSVAAANHNNTEENSQDYEDEVYEDEDGEYYDRDDYDEDGEEEEDEDDHDEVKMLEKRATLYMRKEGDVDWDDHVMGNLTVIYDSDLFGVRIVFEDDGNELRSDTVISINSEMQCIDRECTWSATDYAIDPPDRRTLKAVFSSVQTSQEMYKNFIEGKECATKADIRD